MNLLLLLSALLSALTGVGARSVAPQPVQAVAQARVTHQVPSVIVVRRAVRPAMALPTLAGVASATMIPAAIVSSIPAWMGRRRE